MIIIEQITVEMGQQMCKAEAETTDTLQDKQEVTVVRSNNQDGVRIQTGDGASSSQPHYSQSGSAAQQPVRFKDPNFKYPSLEFASEAAANEVFLDDMVIMQADRVSSKINHTVIDIPFEVAILTTTKRFRECLMSVGRKMYKKYAKGENEKAWKLHRNGYFINFAGDPIVAVMTHSTLYEGRLEQEASMILPTGKGKLLNEHGMYEGEFAHGQASGQGRFTESGTKTKFEGKWDEARMEHGSINSKTLRFEGRFERGKVTGHGELQFKKKKIVYKGLFRDGVFEAEKARYESKGYLYEGGFKYGKKHGQGQLLQKEPDYKDLTTTYRVPQIFMGIWQEDYYLGRNAEEVNLVDTDEYKRNQAEVLRKEEQRRIEEEELRNTGGDILVFREIISEPTVLESGSSQEF